MTQLSMYDSAAWYGNKTLLLAKELSSRSKEADTYAVLAKLYEKTGQYKKALECVRLRFSIDSSLVNERTNEAIARMSESYKSRQREKDNKLLTERVEKQRLQQRSMTILLIAAIIIAGLITAALVHNRNTNKRLRLSNEFIRQQNEKLAELNYEKNTLISIVSHDLNAPFNNISVWNRLLQENAASLDAQQQQAIERISQATQSGIEMIRRVLDVESSEMAHHNLQIASCEVCRLASEIVAGYLPLAQKKNISVHHECNKQHIQLLTDKHLLQRIISNLLSNAIKFTPSHKSVQLIVHDDDTEVTIYVRDEGIGIPPDEVPHLFSRYGILSSRPTGGESSNGLGLFIVKRLVEELNGRISCTSEMGHGTEFRVTFGK
jgi:signal transduction histidine kinase